MRPAASSTRWRCSAAAPGDTAVGSAIPLARLEEITDASGVAPAIELHLPVGVRSRQLHTRTLLLGMQLAQANRRPAHLTEIHTALTSLPETDQQRLGVTADSRGLPHQLTYRQVEHTHRLVIRALARPEPDGTPSPALQQVCDQLTEASIPEALKNASTSLAADWTDVEAWARAVPADAPGTGTDPEASWGHRNVGRTIEEGEMFYGYYLSAATMVADENGQPVPELARRITASSPARDPAAALAAVLAGMAASGIRPGDIIADSGYAHRVPGTWASPLRAVGAQLVQDLHPADRGPRGTHQGAIIANGNLYCPATPGPLLQLGPLLPGATSEQIAAHDQQTAELARYKLGVHAGEDADGYRLARLPRRRREDPLPAAPPVDDIAPRPARDTQPARAPASLLHPADHHRRAGNSREDPAEARLPVSAMADLLRPAHRRRAAQRLHQGHRRQQHRPRLDPPDRRHPAAALAVLPHGRAQPAHHARLRGPPAPRHPARRPRAAAAPRPPTPPHQPHCTRRRATLASLPDQRHGTSRQQPVPPAPAQSRPHAAWRGWRPGCRGCYRCQGAGRQHRRPAKRDQLSATTRMSDPNVTTDADEV